MNPATAAQFFHQIAINNTEIKTKFIPHLVTPMDLQTCRADNKDGAGAIAYQ